MEGLFLLSQLDGLSIIWSKTPRSQYFKAEIDHIRPEWIFVLWLWKWKKKMKRGHFLLHFASVCNDIPLESKEVPIRRKGKEWRLVIHGPAKRWRMPSSFRSLCYYYFIFDVATKRIPLKGWGSGARVQGAGQRAVTLSASEAHAWGPVQSHLVLDHTRVTGSMFSFPSFWFSF